MERNSTSVIGADKCQPRRSNYASFTRRGNTLYVHVHFWPGNTAVIAGLLTTVKSAKLLGSGQKVEFQQDQFRLRLTGLPERPPDHPITTFALECEAEPRQDQYFIRRERPRREV